MINVKNAKPVFILGAARSGTKFLRDILGTSSEVSIIPYDVGYVWRYGNEDYPCDELTSDMLNDKIKNYIRNQLPKLIKKGDNNKNSSFFLEKSVPNTLRPAFIHAVYPDAKFIHLIRDGRAVTESAIRLWTTPPERSYLFKKLGYFPWTNYRYAVSYINNIIQGMLNHDRGQHSWGPRYNGIDEDITKLPLEVVCARQWRRCIEICLSQLSEIKQTNIIEIRYENLMNHSSEIENICGFLNICDKETVIDNYKKKVIYTHAEKWNVLLSTEQLELINDEIGALNSRLGYVKL